MGYPDSIGNVTTNCWTTVALCCNDLDTPHQVSTFGAQWRCPPVDSATGISNWQRSLPLVSGLYLMVVTASDTQPGPGWISTQSSPVQTAAGSPKAVATSLWENVLQLCAEYAASRLHKGLT